MPFSVQRQYEGRCVLLTGSLGYLGSVVLEALLRSTRVGAVFLLVRSKPGGSCAAARVEGLLARPLFHKLTPDAFRRVRVVEGDLNSPELGLSIADRCALRGSIEIVLHCAADIECDAHVQAMLRTNYCGTAELLRVARNFKQLRAFVHTSTFFVNNHRPRNSEVREQLYPLALALNGVQLAHTAYVEAMLALPPDEAARHAAALMSAQGFSSVYALSKHLAEQLVDAAPIRQGVSRAIVRPGLIAGVAGDPYPGYVASYAGAAGFAMGFALGFFQGRQSIAYSSDAVLDVIPADVAAAVLIAAGGAAAATAGAASAARGAVIFHAASSQSYPLTVGRCFAGLRHFWRCNPPPLRLPATRYPVVKEGHAPTPKGMAAGVRTARLKAAVLCGLLRALGRRHECDALRAGLRAFELHNSEHHAKSMVSCTDNVRALRLQLLPAERYTWPLLWEEAGGASWELYGNTYLAGVRRLLFCMAAAPRGVTHGFSFVTAATAGLQLAAAAPPHDGAELADAGGSEADGDGRATALCDSVWSMPRAATAAASILHEIAQLSQSGSKRDGAHNSVWLSSQYSQGATWRTHVARFIAVDAGLAAGRLALGVDERLGGRR